MKSYDDLLTKAYSELPEQMQGGERFTIDKVKGQMGALKI
jgi:translation initiation factor 2 beta subunit (eIF-2beta)/eIF-5